jgi:hypothetical protein
MSTNEFDALLLKKLQEEAIEYDPKSWEQLSERLATSISQPQEVHPFDTLLQQKLQEDTFEYNPKSWQQLSESLEQPAEKEPKVIPFGKKWGIAIGTAAAVCLLAGIAYLLNDSHKTNLQNIPSMVQQQPVQPSNQNANENLNNNPAVQPSTINQPVNTAPFAHQNKGIQQQQNLNILGLNNRPANAPPNTNPSVLQQKVTEEQTPATQEQIAVQPHDTKSALDGFDKAMKAPIVKEQPTNAEIAMRNAAQNWPQDITVAKEGAMGGAKTNVALGGGVNYGNLNTGYNGAVTVKRKISRDFFVDGTVGMMYNNNANNVAVNNGPAFASNLASKPSSTTISSPALAPIQRLYYVQFNPSFGYQIEDKVALSVGGDFQQMVGNKDEVVQPQNDNTKIFPTLDVGLTTKTEFSIMPNLQAGLVYREGLNNLIKGGDNGSYVNRRYLQVQFKYNIPMGK